MVTQETTKPQLADVQALTVCKHSCNPKGVCTYLKCPLLVTAKQYGLHCEGCQYHTLTVAEVLQNKEVEQ